MSNSDAYLNDLYCARCVADTEHYRTAAHTWVCDDCGKIQ